MSVAIKELALGTNLAYGTGTGTPETFTHVAHVKGDIAFPMISSDLVEVTDHDSVGGFKEHILGLSDPGEISFSVYYLVDAPSHMHLVALAQARTIINWKITMVGSASAYSWTFAGMVQKFQPKAVMNGPYEADVTIKITGAPTPPVVA